MRRRRSPRVKGGSQEGVTLKALIRPDAQEAQIAAARNILRALAIFGRRDVVPGKQCQLDGVDFHVILVNQIRSGLRTDDL